MYKKTNFCMFLLLIPLIVLSGCSPAQPSPEGPPTAISPQTGGSGSLEEILGTDRAEDAGPIIQAPTPEPTATPGIIEEGIADSARATGLSNRMFLGLSGENWVNLGISLLIVILGYILVTRLVYRLLRIIARVLPGERYRAFTVTIELQVRVIVEIFLLNYATGRLSFLSVFLKQTLNQLYYALLIIALSSILWKLVDFSLEWYQKKSIDDERWEHRKMLLPLVRRAVLGLLVTIAVTIILNNYGVNVTALLAVLGIGGLALSLAAQDTLSDMIASFLILLDQPFRIGDRIGIEDLDTWGDVVEIGLRTTRVRTRDNRLVIVPNSVIGKNQVVNYSYPDLRYRVETEIILNYGIDLDETRQVIIDAVGMVEGVLPETQVEALLLGMSETNLNFRVRWWIDSYVDTRQVFDRVHSALYNSFKETGIALSLPTYEINLKTDQQASTAAVAPDDSKN